jgi:hypothetical protein
MPLAEGANAIAAKRHRIGTARKAGILLTISIVLFIDSQKLIPQVGLHAR